MSSRIEQIIEEIEEFVEGCKYQPLSTTKIIVNKEELEELLRELRMKTPDEVKRYQKIINNKDAIITDAQEKADTMIADAQAKADAMIADAQEKADTMIADAQAKAAEMVSRHEIMQQAYALANETVATANQQAQEIVDEATIDANDIRMGAISYTDSMLGNMEDILATAINEANEKYANYIATIQSCYEVVAQNRSELIQPAEDVEEEIDIQDIQVEEVELEDEE